jgi:hypothetical protein
MSEASGGIAMSLLGKVVKGAIVLDGNPQLPEGARVLVMVGEDDVINMPAPPNTETHEEHRASLRESIDEMKRGGSGVEARRFLKDIAIKHNLPLQSAE